MKKWLPLNGSVMDYFSYDFLILLTISFATKVLRNSCAALAVVVTVEVSLFRNKAMTKHE